MPGVLLVKAALKWRAEHGGLPSNSRERASFKQLLKSWQRSIEGVPLDVRHVMALHMTAWAMDDFGSASIVKV